MRCGLLGEKLTHSFSPQIHGMLGDYEYRLYEKQADEVAGFVTGGGFDAINVTIPYKQTVIPYCAELSDIAREIGAVNTVVRRADGSLYGDNTDFYGMKYLFEKACLNPASDEKVMILGGGGSALTARAVLKSMGAQNIAVISRSGEDNYGNIGKHCDAKYIINATPVGMYPDNGASPLEDLSIYSNLKSVVDLIYNPSVTALMFMAEERGIAAYNGLAMLAAQAKRAAEIFTDTVIGDDKIELIIDTISKQTKNIVLIGMPGCGKTSVGRALADKTGRGFVDSDEWITATTSRAINTIINDDGEDVFREIESGVLGDICRQSGLVIATGGGIVTRGVNRNIIRQNGTVVFLDREIAKLPTEGRPLSLKNGLEALAEARLPLYRAWADYTVKNYDINAAVVEIYENMCNPSR
jgi:shikimate dehydrogenase